MLARAARAGFGAPDVLLTVALLLVLCFLAIPSVTARAAARRDAQRLEHMRLLEAAITRYWSEHGCWPPAQESADHDGWDVSCDGQFIPALRAGGYLAEPLTDPLDDEQYHYRYRVFGPGSFGCPGELSTFVLGVRSLECGTQNLGSAGGFRCPERDFTREFAWVTGNSVPLR
jgi:hypothetical protein